MVSISTILSVFSGVVGVVIGAAGSYVVMRARQKRITERRRAGTFFDNQAEHLLGLYAELRSCFDTLNGYANQASNGTISKQDFEQEIKPTVASFEDTLRQAELYLSDDEYNEIEEVFAVFARTELHLFWKANHPKNRSPPPVKEMRWSDFLTTYNDTRDDLKKIIRERYADFE